MQIVTSNNISIPSSVEDVVSRGAHVVDRGDGVTIRIRAEPRPTFVYVLAAGEIGLFKIGMTDDPQRRFSEMTDCPLDPVICYLFVFGDRECAQYAERDIHNMLEVQRERREWFWLKRSDKSDIFAMIAIHDGALALDRSDVFLGICKDDLAVVSPIGVEQGLKLDDLPLTEADSQ